jgi:23S rRNA (uracil1939-C5)-methyltransferase
VRRPRHPRRSKRPQTEAAEVTIRGITSEGAGVGNLPDGRAVFVHRTAPGDRVLIRITESKGRWARGLLDGLLEPGPHRRPAPCPLYDRCGGCTVQHLTYEAQLAAKAHVVGEALRRIGAREVENPHVEPAVSEVAYRSRVTYTLRRRPGGGVLAGYHAVDRPERLVDIHDECLLPEPIIQKVWVALRGAWGEGAARLPAGESLRLTLRSAEGGVVLTVDSDRGDGGVGATDGDPGGLVAEIPELLAIWRGRTGSASPRLLAGSPDTVTRWQGFSIPIRTSAFVQVNRAGADMLHEATLRELGAAPRGLRVVDAYCGSGVFGRRLAHHGARVIGIELDPEGAEAARLGEGDLEREGEGSFRVLEGPVEDRLQEALPADVVLVNPPRGGLHPRVPALLREARVPRILYVSCDPATLARDLERLGPGYALRVAKAFDLFPMTSHVETLVVLERADLPQVVYET